MSDTIFALATASGRGAIAVMRISGPRASEVLEKVAGGLPDPRRASLRRLHDATGERVDEAMVLWMPGPASFTGEDSAELHVHGGAAVVAAVAELLAGCGLRPAEPGEFTRRAFQHGRLDLAQAEAVADLVDAETAAQRRQALAQLGGALSARYDGWRDRLLDALAELEAEIDFPDEETPDEAWQGAAPGLRAVLAEMREAAERRTGEHVRQGFRVALTGAPNVGKSSLLNALVGRDAAIVTDIPGTTRDIVEVPLVIGGQAVVLADTAGLRDAAEPIEREGVRRARAWAAAADLRIGVADAGDPATAEAARAMLQEGDILAVNKCDLPGRGGDSLLGSGVIVKTSAFGSPGVEALRGAITSRMALYEGSEFPAITQARHRALLLEAIEHLGRTATADEPPPPELAGEDVRLAIRCLERVTGRVDPEAVLDRVFTSFCIGK